MTLILEAPSNTRCYSQPRLSEHPASGSHKTTFKDMDGVMVSSKGTTGAGSASKGGGGQVGSSQFPAGWPSPPGQACKQSQ